MEFPNNQIHNRVARKMGRPDRVDRDTGIKIHNQIHVKRSVSFVVNGDTKAMRVRIRRKVSNASNVICMDTFGRIADH